MPSSEGVAACAPALSPITALISSPSTGSDTTTLWSYQFPFVPRRARSNSSSRAGTGTSKPYTSSVKPSLYVTVSVVGSRSSAPSF